MQTNRKEMVHNLLQSSLQIELQSDAMPHTETYTSTKNNFWRFYRTLVVHMTGKFQIDVGIR